MRRLEAVTTAKKQGPPVCLLELGFAPGAPGAYDQCMQKRVLIISASAGTGHVRCAQALEKAFALDPQVAEVRHVDALAYTNKVFRDFYSKLYLQLVRNAPT